jgi:hypothetical protein
MASATEVVLDPFNALQETFLSYNKDKLERCTSSIISPGPIAHEQYTAPD